MLTDGHKAPEDSSRNRLNRFSLCPSLAANAAAL